MGAFFTIIIPSYLGRYPNAATNRDKKIFRSLNSVFQQSFTDFEIQFIADGCQTSYDLITEAYGSDSRLKPTILPKQPLWSGKTRNTGIRQAEGKYLLYLDIDDFYGADHLKGLYASLTAANEPKWGFFNDLLGFPNSTFRERHCNPHEKFRNGTSNIVHRRDLGVEWGDGYLHDFLFVKKLLSICPPTILPAGQYCVCHIPKSLDI